MLKYSFLMASAILSFFCITEVRAQASNQSGTSVQTTISEFQEKTRLENPEIRNDLFEMVREVITHLVSPIKEVPTNNYHDSISTSGSTEFKLIKSDFVTDMVAEKILIGLIKMVDPSQAKVSSTKLEDFNYVANHYRILSILKNLEKTAVVSYYYHGVYHPPYYSSGRLDNDRSSFFKSIVSSPSGFDAEKFKLYNFVVLTPSEVDVSGVRGAGKNNVPANQLLFAYTDKPNLRPYLDRLTNLLYPLLLMEEWHRVDDHLKRKELTTLFARRIMMASLEILQRGTEEEIEYWNEKMFIFKNIQKDLLQLVYKDPESDLNPYLYPKSEKIKVITNKYESDIADLETLKTLIEGRNKEQIFAESRKREKEVKDWDERSVAISLDHANSEVRGQLLQFPLVKKLLETPSSYSPVIATLAHYMIPGRKYGGDGIRFKVDQLLYKMNQNVNGHTKDEVVKEVSSALDEILYISDGNQKYFLDSQSTGVLAEMIFEMRFYNLRKTVSSERYSSVNEQVKTSEASASKMNRCLLSLHE